MTMPFAVEFARILGCRRSRSLRSGPPGDDRRRQRPRSSRKARPASPEAMARPERSAAVPAVAPLSASPRPPRRQHIAGRAQGFRPWTAARRACCAARLDEVRRRRRRAATTLRLQLGIVGRSMAPMLGQPRRRQRRAILADEVEMVLPGCPPPRFNRVGEVPFGAFRGPKPSASPETHRSTSASRAAAYLKNSPPPGDQAGRSQIRAMAVSPTRSPDPRRHHHCRPRPH